MNTELVIVKSKTVNNESIPVVFHTVEKTFGGVKDVREISRSYIFQEYQARIPLKMARILVAEQPKEFSIIETADAAAPKELKEKVAKQVKAQEGFACPYCGKISKNKAGLSAHIRYQHPENWVPKSKTKKTKEKKVNK